MIEKALRLWALPWVQWAVLAALVALSVACFGLHAAWMGEKADHAESRSQAAEAVAKASAEALAWSRALQAQTDRATEALNAQRQTIDQLAQQVAQQQREIRVLRTDAADAARLRQYALGPAGGSGDSLAACQFRAGRLADLLAEGAGLVAEVSGLVAEGADLARESARAAQLRAADVDACLAAWPRNKEPVQ